MEMGPATAENADYDRGDRMGLREPEDWGKPGGMTVMKVWLSSWMWWNLYIGQSSLQCDRTMAGRLSHSMTHCGEVLTWLNGTHFRCRQHRPR